MSPKLQLFCLACCLVAVTFAQLPDYSCAPPDTNCSQNSGYSRGDVVGCLYFCEFDANHDSELTRQELDANFVACAGSVDAICPQDVYVAQIMRVLPLCEVEANRLFGEFARQDGDSTSLSITDVDAIWNAFIAAQGGTPSDIAYPASFQTVWWGTWPNVEDLTCTLPFP